MNTQEALSILNISSGATKDEVDRAFKVLAVKFHPDKTGGDDVEFKKISEAYEFIKKSNYKTLLHVNDVFDIYDGNFYQGFSYSENDITNAFKVNFSGPFRRSSARLLSMEERIEISFKESVFGTTKEIDISGKRYCKDCKSFFISINNRCEQCNSNKIETLSECKINVTIPAGTLPKKTVKVKNQLKIENISYDLIFTIDVSEDPVLKIDPSNYANIISNINISLLDALKGCVVPVETIYGTKKLKIKPMIKNGDSIIGKGLGIMGGVHTFNVIVDYPEGEDLNKVIEILESKEICHS